MTGTTCVFIVMGVAGAGKSTVASGLAAHFGAAFLEGDDFHPPANVEKMARGEPLNDADRGPWIDALAAAISHAPETLVFASCSALTPAVRARLRQKNGRRTEFLFLDAPEAAIQKRLENRQGHFMKARMLRSQFETLRPPDEAIVVNAALEPEAVLEAAIAGVEAALKDADGV